MNSGHFKKGHEPLQQNPWKKGESGNPRGRVPVSKEIKTLFRKGTPEVIKMMLLMIKDPTVAANVRLLAMKEWLDRDLGKLVPVQQLAPQQPLNYNALEGPNEMGPPSVVITLPSNGYELDIREAGEIKPLEDEVTEEVDATVTLNHSEFGVDKDDLRDD